MKTEKIEIKQFDILHFICGLAMAMIGIVLMYITWENSNPKFYPSVIQMSLAITFGLGCFMFILGMVMMALTKETTYVVEGYKKEVD